jgi:glycosidase
MDTNYKTINLEQNLAGTHSVFRYYQDMIALRKRTPALIYGEFVPQDAPEELFVYQRVYQGQSFLVVLNLSESEVRYSSEGRLLIGNYKEPDRTELQPYEARVYACS